MIELGKIETTGDVSQTYKEPFAESDRDFQTVYITVDLPSEFQALLSGLSSAGGRDSEGSISTVWKIEGIKAIDFSQCEPGKTMAYTVEPGGDVEQIYHSLDEWLIELRARRQRTERSLASWAIKR